MAANFDRWERDPFFSAAEEVQESADRMESVYRTWLNSTKSTSAELNREDVRRDLSTALDAAKWQLEEFERAVQSSYNESNANEAKHRHGQFVLALEGKVSMIQNSLLESADSNGKHLPPLIQLNEGECDELALFISGPQASLPSGRTEVQAKDGLRRTASADISSWNIAIPEHGLASHSSNGHIDMLPRRVPSFSAFGTVESVPNNKLPNSSFWKDDDVALLRSQMQNRTCAEGILSSTVCSVNASNLWGNSSTLYDGIMLSVHMKLVACGSLPQFHISSNINLYLLLSSC